MSNQNKNTTNNKKIKQNKETKPIADYLRNFGNLFKNAVFFNNRYKGRKRDQREMHRVYFQKFIEENFPNIKKEASNKFKRNTKHQIIRTTEETPHGT